MLDHVQHQHGRQRRQMADKLVSHGERLRNERHLNDNKMNEGVPRWM